MDDDSTNPYQVRGRTAALISGDDRRCTATNRAGDRCGRSRVVGLAVCDLHGGRQPAALTAARERTERFLFPKAIHALNRALTPTADPCPQCGRSDDDLHPVRVRAAIAVAHMVPEQTRAALGGSQSDSSWAEHLTDAELATVAAIMQTAKARAAGARLALPAADDDVITIDAEDDDAE
jgi:hypothetical protein